LLAAWGNFGYSVRFRKVRSLSSSIVETDRRAIKWRQPAETQRPALPLSCPL
jgi:hypothetical protein